MPTLWRHFGVSTCGTACRRRRCEHLLAGAAGDRPENVRPDDPRLSSVEHHIVRRNLDACRAMVGAVEAQGYRGLLVGHALQGEARWLGVMHAGLALGAVADGVPLAPPCALVTGGEATVTVQGDGTRRTQSGDLPGCRAVAGRTSHHVPLRGHRRHRREHARCRRRRRRRLDGSGARRGSGHQSRALRENDSGGALAAMGDALVTGPTGTNVADVRLLLIGGSSRGTCRWLTSASRRTGAMVRLTLPTVGLSMALALVTTYLPLTLRRYTGSATLIGFAIGGEGLFALAIPLVVGAVSDRTWTRWGRRRPYMVVAAPVMAVAMALAPMQPGYVRIAACVFVFFAAYHVYTAPYQALIPDSVPYARHGQVQGMQTLMRGIGDVRGDGGGRSPPAAVGTAALRPRVRPVAGGHGDHGSHDRGGASAKTATQAHGRGSSRCCARRW